MKPVKNKQPYMPGDYWCGKRIISLIPCGGKHICARGYVNFAVCSGMRRTFGTEGDEANIASCIWKVAEINQRCYLVSNETYKK